MRTIIIEDEKPAARRLNRLLDELDVPVETMLHSVRESIEYLKNHTPPDLIFLDIQLSDGLSFEIFEEVEVKSAIIFTTAYDEYALKAFKLNSIDYLLKPIDDDELRNALEQFKKLSKNTSNIQSVDLASIARLLQNPDQSEYKKRYTSRVGDHLKLFSVEEIQLFFSENKGTYINLQNGRNYLIDHKLESLVNELDPARFYRISRQAIINIKAIKDMVSYTNSRLQIKVDSFNEFPLIVSREKVRGFKDWLEQ
ncbi:MAG: LytTR family DNA-binding domain-containing protein [Nonlabens sp.]